MVEGVALMDSAPGLFKPGSVRLVTTLDAVYHESGMDDRKGEGRDRNGHGLKRRRITSKDEMITKDEEMSTKEGEPVKGWRNT
jgi:hypothetical protein